MHHWFNLRPGFSRGGLLALSLAAALGAGLAGRAQVMAAPVSLAQANPPTLDVEEVEITPVPPSQPNPVVRPGNISSTSLSVEGARQLMTEAEAAIANQDFTTAEAKLRSARDLLNQLSTYYQELAQMFIGIDTLINRSNREKALETAQMRDQATYQLALVYRAQNKPDLAVPLLMEILRSQQPTRELGQRAYQQLFELGFVSEPYAGRAASTPTPTSGE
ncbi:MAG TPA: hypothetical protein IGR64_10455 [Leptolyngbyaceae cyanobacterium M65_K2018_010]|nr:hypothetical protein [Leptolyngbyaceae cyanobacterium M65_K2018_010]